MNKEVCHFCNKYYTQTNCESCSVGMCNKCEGHLSLELSTGEKGCVECEH